MAKNYDLILLQSKSLLEDFKLYNTKKEFEQKTVDEFNQLMIVKYEYLYVESQPHILPYPNLLDLRLRKHVD